MIGDFDSSFDGISQAKVEEKTEKYGKNKLAEGKKTSIFMRFLSQFADPMVLVLIAAAIISAITAIISNESFTDVIIILAVVLLNAVLGVIQESKSEKAIEALKKMSAATSKVLRDGRMTIVKSEDLVPGDVVLLEAGDAVPADGRIIECASLKIEESALTGESVAVEKTDAALTISDTSKDIPLGDHKNMAYMGSNVVYGRGRLLVTNTGMSTEMGKIAYAISQAEDGQTPLQKKLASLSKILTVLVLAICVVMFGVSLLKADSITPQTMLDTFMIAVSLAVAAIPEGLAAVVTIVLSMGVTRMSRRNAIIRRLTAVETLGCTQVICSDKTGTLTQNKMTVVEHYGDETLLATAMALCNDAKAEGGENGGAIGEPTECALVNYATSIGIRQSELEAAQPRVGEAPFDSMRKMMSTVHEVDGRWIQYTKGAPDEVLKCCKYVLVDGKPEPMSDEVRAEITAQNSAYAAKALRVLSAAFRIHQEKPSEFSPEYLENELIFIGLTGMIDPIRPEVTAAINDCLTAGIKPVMITGDHRDTAIAIAKQLGIITDESEAITGSELDDISDEELKDKIKQYSVYARVQPEHKVRIVKAWRELGMVTAMTGDGVNDAPSIKNADIGIGMGITGTDVTKNVADMILADDNFATIVSAVGEGRKIYDNIRKSIQFLLSSNLSEVIGIFAATLMGFTLLKPIHILFINLITDSLPALALGVDPAEEDIMKRKPRASTDGIFSGGVGFSVAYQGVLVAALTLLAYFVGERMQNGAWAIRESTDGMTMAFLTMSMAEIFHSYNMRSQNGSIFRLKNHNMLLFGSMLLSLVLTTAVIYVPFLNQAFQFAHISFVEYLVAMLLALSIIPIVELVKLARRIFAKKK